MRESILKKLVIDIDETICTTLLGDYKNSQPDLNVINKIREYKKMGFEICFYTSRNMRTFENNIGKITAQTLPNIVNWLNQHDVPYDEIVVGKPWCGFEGFYVDDKAIRPDEFVKLSYAEIQQLINEK